MNGRRVVLFPQQHISLVIFSRHLKGGLKIVWFEKEECGCEFMVCHYMLGILISLNFVYLIVEG